MKAVRFHETGGPEVLRYEDVERPDPGSGDVRIRVAGVAYNPADGGMRGGFLPIPISLPHIPGYDVSGTVETLGAGVDTLAVGDDVVGFIPMSGDGGAAEYAVAPAASFVAAPSRVPLADAAGLPSVALTAAQALSAAGLDAGDRIVINGAGGPVGGYAIQLAKQVGAHVIATASPRSFGTVSDLGADEIIDHTTGDLLNALGDPVDVLLNLAPIAPDRFAELARRVRDGGVVVSTTPTVATPSDEDRDVRGVTIFVEPDAATLTRLVGQIDRGELRIDIAERVPLSGLADLHRRAEAGLVRGKVVIVPPRSADPVAASA